MDRHVLMPFFISIILPDILQIITTDYNRSVHFCFPDYPCKDTSTNVHVASKRALLIDICAINGLFWSFIAQTDALIISSAISAFHFLLLESILFLTMLLNTI